MIPRLGHVDLPFVAESSKELQKECRMSFPEHLFTATVPGKKCDSHLHSACVYFVLSVGKLVQYLVTSFFVSKWGFPHLPITVFVVVFACMIFQFFGPRWKISILSTCAIVCVL